MMMKMTLAAGVGMSAVTLLMVKKSLAGVWWLLDK
jgi:hypothetical protein